MKVAVSGRKRVFRAGACLALLVEASCTAILGVDGLPPATDSVSDAPLFDATRPRLDAMADVANDAHADAPRADGATIDATTTDGSAKDSASPTVFQISPASPIDFGDAGGKLGFIACGSTNAPVRQLTLTNNGAIALSWWSSLGLGGASPFKLSSECTATVTCTIQPGKSTVVTITGPVAPTDAGLTSYNDTLTLFSSVTGGVSANLQLQAAAYGAVLAFSQGDINFGPQPENQPDGGYPHTEVLENMGNGPFSGRLTLHGPLVGTDGGLIDASGTVATKFALERIGDAAVLDGAPTFVAGDGGTAISVAFEPARSAADAAASLFLSSVGTTTLCANLPAPVTLEGVGNASPISVTSSLSFFSSQSNGVGVLCGAVAAPQSIMVTNAGAATAMVTSLTLLSGTTSPFSVPATPIAIPGGTPATPGSATIAVTPSTIPMTAYPGQSFSDTLVVTTNITGDAPHFVELEMTAAGALVVAGMTSATFTTTSVGTVTNYNMVVENLGNINASWASFASSDSAFDWRVPNIGPGNPPLMFPVQFEPSGPGSFSNATLTAVLQAGTFCSPSFAPFNGTLSLTVSGSAAVGPVGVNTRVNPNEVKFNGTCALAGMVGTPQTFTLTIENPGPAVNWSAALDGPGSPLFVLSSPGGSLPSNTNLQVTVTAVGLSSTSGLTQVQAAAGASAEAVFTFTNSSGSYVASIPIIENISGDFLTWSTTAVGVPPLGANEISLFEWGSHPNATTVASGNGVFGSHAGNPAFLGAPFPGDHLRQQRFHRSDDDDLCGHLGSALRTAPAHSHSHARRRALVSPLARRPGP